MEVGQLIAITVEKGMNWKDVVVPTTTKPSAAAPPATAADKTPAASGQYAEEIFL